MAFCYYLHKNLIKWVRLGTNHLLAGLAIDLLMYPLSHGDLSEGSSEAWWDSKAPPWMLWLSATSASEKAVLSS